MKNKFMKKAAAAILSGAMALTMLPLPGLTNVSAKAPYVKLNTTFKTLKAGQTYKLKLKNNTLGWKVKEAVSKDSTICKAVNKKSYIKLTAKGEGRTTIRVTLKTAKRKGANAVKKLSCRVNVKPAEVQKIPETPETPVLPDTPKAETDKTVETQAELDQALADKGLTSITLSTAASGVFTIPAGEYTNVDFTVNAPNADIENHAVFKSVTIQAIKENTWKEKAKGNLIRVLAGKAHVIVDTDASVKSIVYAGEYADASINLEINGAVENVSLQRSVKAAITAAETADISNIMCAASDTNVQLDIKGIVRNVMLQAAVTLNITGSPKAAAAVTAAETAKGAVVRTSAKVEILVKADISIHLEKGAQGSRVEITEKTVTVSVENKTGVTIEVKKPDGTISRVVNNSTVSIKDGQAAQGTTNTSGTYVPPSGVLPDDHAPVIDLSKVTVEFNGTIVVTGTALNPVFDGVLIADDPEGGLMSSGVVTEGALKLKYRLTEIPEGIEVEGGEEHKKQLMEGSEIDLYVKGQDLSGYQILRMPIGTASGKEVEIYLCIRVAKSKWVTADGVLTDSDWDVEIYRTKDEVEKNTGVKFNSN